MNLIIFVLAFATAVLSAEKFDCRVYKPSDYGGGVYLKAIYIDGVLRGDLFDVRDFDTKPINFSKDNNLKQSQVSVMTADMYTIKTTSVHVRELSYVSGSKYRISFHSDTFYIPMSKAELNAARFRDDRGDKCLGVWFTSEP